MGLFRRKKAQAHVDPALLDALKKYVEQHGVAEAKTEGQIPAGSGIRYSLAESDDTISDMKKFLSDARQDTAMFDALIGWAGSEYERTQCISDEYERGEVH